MKRVFILHHTHEFEDGHEDVKLIGVYATKEDAQTALKRVANQPGFRNTQHGFSINEHELGKDGWTEGYVTT